MENGRIKERSGDVRHLKTCDTVFVQYIQKPLTSVRDVKSIAQMKFTGKSGFLISATIPHPTSHFSFTLLFHFQKRSAWKLSLSSPTHSVHLNSYKMRHLSNVNKCSSNKKWLDAWTWSDACERWCEYSTLSCVFFFAFRSVNVYNLKAHTSSLIHQGSFRGQINVRGMGDDDIRIIKSLNNKQRTNEEKL